MPGGDYRLHEVGLGADLVQYRTRRIVVVSFAIFCLTIAALVLMWVRFHAPFAKDDLYWMLD